MRLEKLDLTNFKCFTHQSLRFAKLTVLLGANSSGKSSLLHGVLAALQTDQFPFALSTNGHLVNLGDFRAIAHGRRIGQPIGVTLTVSGLSAGKVTFSGDFAHSAKTGTPELLRAEVTDPSFSLKITREEGYRADWTYDAKADPFRRTQQLPGMIDVFQGIAKLMEEAKRKASRSKRRRLQAEAFVPADLLATPPPSGNFTFSTPREMSERMPHHLALHHHFAAWSYAASDFRRFFHYVGSFRLEPQRSYYQVAKGDLSVLRDGDNTIEQLAEWQQQKARQLRLLVRALTRLRLLSAVRAAPLGSGLFEVKVRPSATSVPVSLPDAGFGIGQLLPILVADLQLPNGGTLAVSQPEIHLHPSAQAELAEHFVRGTRLRKTRYIIETHSEYFLNRLRLLVAKGKLSSEDVSVLYLTNDGSKTTAYEIHLLPNGRIEGAPDDFFKTYMMDVMNIALSGNAK